MDERQSLSPVLVKSVNNNFERIAVIKNEITNEYSYEVFGGRSTELGLKAASYNAKHFDMVPYGGGPRNFILVSQHRINNNFRSKMYIRFKTSKDPYGLANELIKEP